jgi:8-amino-7-oxononanoate synthase
MSSLDTELDRRLGELRDQSLYRQLRCINSAQSPHINTDGKTLLNFSSNDYLGLANDPVLKEAAVQALERYGAGAGASRLISGSLVPHHRLDETIADFKGTAAALSFTTGYATALGAICALLDKGDLIILDKLVHASIVDAARLCGAKIRVFAHNDLNDLEAILKWADRRPVHGAESTSARSPQKLIVTESVFSMDGDRAPLGEIVELKEKYGAWLMVDEAHAAGVMGPHRRGLAEALGVSHRIEVQMGTLGKALGASGGFICGSRALVDYLINRARPFIFSTAPVPAAAAAANAGIQFVQSAAGADRCRALWQRVSDLTSALAFLAGRSTAGEGTTPVTLSQILPVLVGDESTAVAAASALREQGIFIPAIRYPTVARGRARLRVSLTSQHTHEDIQQLTDALKGLADKLDLRQPSNQPDAFHR